MEPDRHNVDTQGVHSVHLEALMNTAMSTLSRLLSPRRREVAGPDPADMGTCFGMEMTLQPDPQPLESEQRRARAAAADAPAAGGAATARRGWRPFSARAARKDPLAA